MSYNLGDKITKTLTGLGDFQFTCMEVANGNEVFLCDEVVTVNVNYSEAVSFASSLGAGYSLPSKDQLTSWFEQTGFNDSFGYPIYENAALRQYNGGNAVYWTSTPSTWDGGAYAFGGTMEVWLTQPSVTQKNDSIGVCPCFTISATPSTKPSVKLGVLAKAWKVAYTPVTPSLEIGVSKMTKNILGTDYGFTYVGDKDGQAVFMCDDNVDYNDYSLVLNNMAGSYLDEYFIPTVEDIGNWISIDSPFTTGQTKTASLDINSPIYDFITKKIYWTSSQFNMATPYFINGTFGIDAQQLTGKSGIRPCFAINK